MSLISTSLFTARSFLRRALGLVRDLAPWLLQAATGWLLARLRGGSATVGSKCPDCPFRSANGPPTPTTYGTGSQTASGSSHKVTVPSMLLLLSLSLLSAPLAGCTPTASYIAADRQTFDAIAPEYEAYITSDPALDDLRRTRRRRTIESWRIRIQRAESTTSE